MKIAKGFVGFVAIAMSLTALTGCGGSNESSSQDTKKPDSISFWYYNADTASQTKAWKMAAQEFTKETGVKVKFEVKSFAQIAQNGSQFLNSDQVPDVMVSNRGNGSAGMLSSMGLLSDLGPYVKKYGWDKKVTSADASIAKYDDKGVMGGKTWYGAPTYAEFQRVYYNMDLFEKYGIKVPETFDEFVDACQKFKDAGVTPIAADAQEYGVLWLWWSLVSTHADRKFIDDWHMYKHPVDWNSKALKFATNTIQDWLNKGFISRNATGLKAEDTTTSFIRGEYPIYQTGTWNQGRFNEQITTFKWDGGILPGSRFAQGCTGNLLTIPEKAKHKDLSAQLINTALTTKVQNSLAKNGGIPLAADLKTVDNPKNKKMIDEYQEFSKKGALSYYPDYAASNLTDAMSSTFQELVNGTKTPDQALDAIKNAYITGVKDMGVKE